MMPASLKKLWVPRSEWGARPPKHNYTVMTPEIIVLHHTFSPSAKQFQGAKTIQGIQNFHMDDPTTNWNDIGYHFLVAPFGSAIFEGRPFMVEGSHCGGKIKPGVKRCFNNEKSIGGCAIGNYDQEEPDSQMIIVFQAMVDWLMQEHRIGRDRIFGHFQSQRPPRKTCPGKHLAEAMGLGPQWNIAFPGK